ncbi:hypothetical protein Dimus_039430 [Dionaea muscipula]
MHPSGMPDPADPRLTLRSFQLSLPIPPTYVAPSLAPTPEPMHPTVFTNPPCVPDTISSAYLLTPPLLTPNKLLLKQQVETLTTKLLSSKASRRRFILPKRARSI